ncbi:MAG TPA: DNA mismatch repair endonuclease MutL [Lentisphaeria bacterium]|nr:DNA mismatch repair endonuclease MutL [Lentisphaeria bacterium]
MSIIRILPEDVSNRIAAGEVIERPASVVKELVENALDAGTTRLTIQVDRGGRSLVRVIDNGCGMDAEDALMCLEAHATSKIRERTDIGDIRTLGFRGEALPSIASVTRFQLRTRPNDADEGTEVNVTGGVIQNVGPTGCAPGTTVQVRNLFFNLPARKKFLRSIATEESHIQEIVQLLALAHPEVSFDLSFDDRSILSVQGGSDMRTRAAMLLGRETVAGMVPVDHADDHIHVTGFAARPGLTRSTRRDQRTFVNGRPVTADGIHFAIRDAYHSMVMKGRYPPVLLFITLPPDRVDINVHPAKREVRFREHRQVGEVVSAGIRQALRGLSQPEIIPSPAQPQMMPAAAQVILPSNAPDTADAAETISPSPVPSMPGPSSAPAYPDALPPPPMPASTSISAADPDELLRLRVIGAITDLYLLAEGSTGLVLIDQHAAHERVMFERILQQAQSKDGTGQGLLIPITIDLSAADANALRENLDAMASLGFAIEDFGGNSFIISAVPAHFPQENVAGMLHDIIDDLRDRPLRERRADEGAIAMAACKAAVKAHDHLEASEIDKLLEELGNTQLPYTCPHGRPTMINISFAELEKRFGRRA